MSSSKPLSDIPINVVSNSPGRKLHWQRRGLQITTLLLAYLIPISGLFRIDPIAGAFIILDRQIWWSDFFLVFGVWLSIAAGLVMLYSFVGTAFCGWSCPQNTLSEWANLVTRKLLGKRAEVQLNGGKMAVGNKRNTWVNWVVLALLIFAASMVLGLLPLFYFYPPAVVWDFVTFQTNDSLAASLHYIYFIIVILFVIDIGFIRHFWCRFMCIYKVWQHGFKTKHTLHIAYDDTRSDLCAKCNYCTTACFIDLDPRKTEIYDTCINCGECITACNTLQAKNGQPGLLRFEVGDQVASKKALIKIPLSSLSSRITWTVPFMALGLSMFAWGLVSYEHYHLAAYRADIAHGAEIRDYRISVSNKLYKNASAQISVQGLPDGGFTLSDSEIQFTSANRIDVKLHIHADMPPGIHSFIVNVSTTDGWQDSYRVQHFVGRG